MIRCGIHSPVKVHAKHMIALHGDLFSQLDEINFWKIRILSYPIILHAFHQHIWPVITAGHYLLCKVLDHLFWTNLLAELRVLDVVRGWGFMAQRQIKADNLRWQEQWCALCVLAGTLWSYVVGILIFHLETWGQVLARLGVGFINAIEWWQKTVISRWITSIVAPMFEWGEVVCFLTWDLVVSLLYAPWCIIVPFALCNSVLFLSLRMQHKRHHHIGKRRWVDDKKLAGFWYSMTTWTSTRAVLWSNRVGWPWPGRVGLALGLGLVLVLALDTWVLWGQWGLWDAAGNLLHLQVVRDGNLQVARDLMAAQVVRDLKGAHLAGKASKAVERDGMVVRDGKVAKDGKVVARDGKVVARDGKVVARDGKVVARDGKVVVRDGKVVARDGGAARDGEDLALVLACLAATAMRPSCIDDSYNEKVLNLSLSRFLSLSTQYLYKSWEIYAVLGQGR